MSAEMSIWMKVAFRALSWRFFDDLWDIEKWSDDGRGVLFVGMFGVSVFPVFDICRNEHSDEIYY
jgi:hypothetical protein